MSRTSMFSDLLQSIAERGRSFVDRRRGDEATADGLIALCEDLLSGRGEASGIALAEEVLGCYAALDEDGRLSFFRQLSEQFGADPAGLAAAARAYLDNPEDGRAHQLHQMSESRRQELLRRINLAPNGTAGLVAMRADLVGFVARGEALGDVDRDFVHLFSSWFNRGFLVLERIDWHTPAAVLEKIINYEAVHRIHDWDDLRRRIDPVDRRCYAFFHPAMVDEPLIFVEVALTEGMPDAIEPILSDERDAVPLDRVDTAVFYSISNCQVGLRGINFGNFLIKQVVEELRTEMNWLESFVTLSPVPGFAAWLDEIRRGEEGVSDFADVLDLLDRGSWWRHSAATQRLKDPLSRLAAWYLVQARDPQGRPLDPVAKFHLNNGARLERINWLADKSTAGLAQSYGVMVNYLYKLEDIEKNHEALANQGVVAAAPAVSRLTRNLQLSKPAA